MKNKQSQIQGIFLVALIILLFSPLSAKANPNIQQMLEMMKAQQNQLDSIKAKPML
jgi:hypothetical protein